MAEELRNVRVEEYLKLADDFRYSFFSDDGSGPEIFDLVTLMCGCPELCRMVEIDDALA